MTLATPENVTALDRAAELISDPDRWCRAAYARTKGKRDTEVNSPDACRWCASGAIRKYSTDSHLDLAVSGVARSYYEMFLYQVNDSRRRYLGRVAAKHCIEALAAELRSQLP